MAFATRVRGVDPGPATIDLGEEPPAVVDLVTNGWRVTPDAIPATLLDLAARDYVDLEQQGPGRTLCRVRRTAGEGLEVYERMVLDHVAGLAVDGVVPAEALTTGPQDQSSRWWRAFQRAVVDDARERGLARDRWSVPAKAFLRAAALVPAGLGVPLADAAAGLSFGTIGAGLVIWAVLTSSIRLVGDQRDTPAGAEAAAHWLGVRDHLGRNELFPTLPRASVAIWDRYLGYGAALGVATAAVHAVPMGAEDDHRAWSAYGGRWRMVKVRYRGSASPGDASRPWGSSAAWSRPAPAMWSCGSCWACGAGPMGTSRSTRRPGGCAWWRPPWPCSPCWSSPGERGRCCARPSTSSPGGRSRAR
jgi:Predicted membrane protein (DUF2207)